MTTDTPPSPADPDFNWPLCAEDVLESPYSVDPVCTSSRYRIDRLERISRVWVVEAFRLKRKHADGSAFNWSKKNRRRFRVIDVQNNRLLSVFGPKGTVFESGPFQDYTLFKVKDADADFYQTPINKLYRPKYPTFPEISDVEIEKAKRDFEEETARLQLFMNPDFKSESEKLSRSLNEHDPKINEYLEQAFYPKKQSTPNPANSHMSAQAKTIDEIQNIVSGTQSMNPDNIKADTTVYYRDKHGNKLRILATDSDEPFPIIVSYREKDQIGEKASVTSIDWLIYRELTPWIEPLDFDWSCIPAWHDKITMDEDGTWDSWGINPELFATNWADNTGDLVIHVIKIPPAYAPKNFTGDWKSSLHYRPKH